MNRGPLDRVEFWAVPAGERWLVLAGVHEDGRYWEVEVAGPMPEVEALGVLHALGGPCGSC